MRMWKLAVMALVLGALSVSAGAASMEMANLVPADSKGMIETVDAAGTRQMMLDSKFWAALEQTEAFKEWRASQKYAQMQERVERLLKNLDMPLDVALKTYLGGRSAVVQLAGDNKKDGVFLTEATNEMAQRLVRATGGIEVKRHLDVAIWEVRNDEKVDHMAFAGGVMLMTGSEGDALERTLDVIVGGGAALGTEGHFKAATDALPAGWRTRAYGAVCPPRKGPGAIAMYPAADKGRIHFEWRLVSAPIDISMTAPEVLTVTSAIPDKAVAAGATALHLAPIWNFVKGKIGEKPDAQEKLRKAEMFVRGLFPGESMDSICAAFGPEAGAALLKGDGGSAPGAVALLKLTGTGKPVANAFKNGLAAKAMILGAMSNQENKGPKLNVREESYNNVSMVIIEAPEVLEKFLGAWAKDVGITIAVTDTWLIVGTTPAGVKQSIDTAADPTGKGSLAAALKKDGENVPTTPTTHWGVIEPASGADIVIDAAERFIGTQRIEKLKKAANLAELMGLVKRVIWQRVDEPAVIRGSADIQATN